MRPSQVTVQNLAELSQKSDVYPFFSKHEPYLFRSGFVGSGVFMQLNS